MDILQQCQKWHENDEYQKIIDTLEALAERTPEEDSELARAYNNLAGQSYPEGRDLLRKAIALLKPHEDYFSGDHFWNFRMGYAYYYLDQAGRALPYFRAALKARPDDEDTKVFIAWCDEGISLPRFSQSFRERTESAWECFAGQEARLRRIMDTDEKNERAAELVEQCQAILNQAFDDIAFEMGLGGDKYELILSPEGDEARLFELVYFQKHAPARVKEHWNILVGRQPNPDIALRTDDGWEINGRDVRVWVEQRGENSFALFAYSEKLPQRQSEDDGRPEWMLYTLTDQILGEISHMRCIDEFNLLDAPREEPYITLSELPDRLKELGAKLSADPEDYLASYTGYQMEPDKDSAADWRLDSISGSTCCAPLVKGYLSADNYFVDELEADGAAAGFFCYPLDTLREKEGSRKIFDFRDKLEEALASDDGEEILTVTGGATGIYCGYVDFIAWDIGAALDKAAEFFRGTDIPWASFHTFRREAGTVALKRPEDVYDEAEMDAVQAHIEKYFGAIEHVYHELDSPDIHVDICVAPPDGERDYYTLATMGMGAHRMNVPGELAESKLEWAELVIALPRYWKLDQEYLKDERWYWPIRLLKDLARLPIHTDSWLGRGHSVSNGEQEFFAEGTKLCASVLIAPQGVEKGAEVCALPDGEEVNFYQVIPLYEDELEYKLSHDADALLDRMEAEGISFVVNPVRRDAISGNAFYDEGFDGVMDDARWHLETIHEKELPVEEITAFNHMAIYLRWCVEFHLMSGDFLAEHGETVRKVKEDPAGADLREFIRDELDGQLSGLLFSSKGRAFAGYYYGYGDSPDYTRDIDDYALKYFGPARYHSDEFKDEAYLFIPFDETYYQDMAEVIGERFVSWQDQDVDKSTLEPSDTARAVMDYLDCECTYFLSMKDDDPIMSAYGYARRLGVREGYIPVLIRADDETLLEYLVMNSDPEHDADFYEFDPAAVAEYRKKMLAAPAADGRAVLTEWIGRIKAEAEDEETDWEKEILGEVEGGFDNCRFASCWNSETDMTYPLILAKIPVKHPWEIFAYLPFGNWNDCPDTPELTAVAKYWFEKYGAVPAAMTHDELEFLLPAPVPEDQAMELAQEQYGLCPDMVDQGAEDATVGTLADTLRQSTVWYFWWD